MAEPTGQVVIRHNCDFDFRVFVSTTASPEGVTTLLDELQGQTQRLHVVLRVCRIFVGLAVAGAKVAAGPWAWWSLVRTLIRLYGDITDEDMQLIAAPLAS